MLDAYTVRKAVPRIIIAAVAINLSIYLCVMVIDVVNVIGHGLSNFIVTPFLNQNPDFRDLSIENNTSYTISGIMGIITILGGSAGLVYVFGSAVFLGAVGIVAAFLISAFFLAIAVIFTIIIRQAIIIFLIISSPIAIALLVLPGTEKYFKKWLDLFVTTLMVYPIISAIFAMSTVFTTILIGTAAKSPDAIGLAKLLAAIVTAFAPLIMIPFAFKLAGGAISTIMNAGAGKGRTLAGSTRQRIEKSKDNPDSFLGRMKTSNMESRSRRGTTGRQLLAKGRNLHNRDQRRAAVAAARQSENVMSAKRRVSQSDWEYMKDDDKIMTDLAEYSSGEKSRAAIMNESHSQMKDSRKNATKKIREKYGLGENAALTADHSRQIEEMVNQDKQQMLAASAAADRVGRSQATRAEAASSQAYIAYGLASGEAGWNQMTAARDDIFGKEDTAEKRSFTNRFQYAAKGSGRFDLSGATDDGEYNPDRGWNSSTLYQLSQSKPADTEAHVNRTLELLGSTNADERKAGAVRVQELKNMLPNATGGVRNVIVSKLADMEEGSQRYYDQMAANELAGNAEYLGRSGEEQAKIRQTYAKKAESELSKVARVYERPDPTDPNYRKFQEDQK